MTGGDLDMREQRAVLAQMRELARKLETGGDPFLNGHYLHLRERIETVLAITEARSTDLAGT